MLALNRDNYKDYITLKNGNDIIDLPKDGIAINEKLAYVHNLKVGDSFSMIVNNKEYTFKVGAVVKNYFGHIAIWIKIIIKKYLEKIIKIIHL